ncbi:hypothetical protein ACJ2A9_20245, partial [Anaerobacillus sp. MEB173]|uniref:hypothetical protein n=1 Tax=Anaerobacillus sp. MEB173 TaxID=3383345 RepID=UPI003F8DFE58
MVKKREIKSNKAGVSKKVLPLVLSTSMLASTFIAAGAPVLADELEIAEKNHGQIVSEAASSIPGSFEKGKIISELAKSNKDQSSVIEDGLEDEGTEAEEDVLEDE